MTTASRPPDDTPPDEEMVPHPFNSRTRYEPGDDRDIWCKDCEYHRDHEIHSLHTKIYPPPVAPDNPTCDCGTTVVNLAHQMPVSGRTEIAVDACIAPLIQLLNDHGVHTTGCCCGHGRGEGSVLFEQGGGQLELKLPTTRKISLSQHEAYAREVQQLIQRWRAAAKQAKANMYAGLRFETFTQCADELAALKKDHRGLRKAVSLI